MARFEANGLEDLMIDLRTIAEVPQSVIIEMLEAGGKVIARAHEESLNYFGLVETGTLKSSITVHRKTHTVNSFYVLVYPYGTHHRYHAKSGSYTKYNWGRAGGTRSKGGGTKEATNNDVGFVQEFGGHGNEPTQWMRIANEKFAGEAIDAEFKVYDDYLRSKNL